MRLESDPVSARCCCALHAAVARRCAPHPPRLTARISACAGGVGRIGWPAGRTALQCVLQGRPRRWFAKGRSLQEPALWAANAPLHDAGPCSSARSPLPLALARTRSTEAERDAAEEPLLSSFLYASILAHDSFERALAFVLSNRLASAVMLPTQLFEIFHEVLTSDSDVREGALADVEACRDRVGTRGERALLAMHLEALARAALHGCACGGALPAFGPYCSALAVVVTCQRLVPRVRLTFANAAVNPRICLQDPACRSFSQVRLWQGSRGHTVLCTKRQRSCCSSTDRSCNPRTAP